MPSSISSADVRADKTPRGSLAIPVSRRTVDYATILGIFSGFALIATATVIGGSPGSFVDVPSMLIVIGGTLAVTTVCFTVPEVFRTYRVILNAIFPTTQDAGAAATQMLQLAETSRKKGILSLQDVLPRLEGEPFLYKSLTMLVDGLPSEEVERIMRRDLESTASRHMKSASVLRKAAEVSPAMGLIGTLVGLVQMLGHLDDPSGIGPAMAVALLTTFYGAVMANMLFSPLAAKLERNSREELLVHHLYLMGTASIGRQENPRRLEMLLNTVLPPAKRIQYFD